MIQSNPLPSKTRATTSGRTRSATTVARRDTRGKKGHPQFRHPDKDDNASKASKKSKSSSRSSESSSSTNKDGGKTQKEFKITKKAFMQLETHVEELNCDSSITDSKAHFLSMKHHSSQR